MTLPAESFREPKLQVEAGAEAITALNSDGLAVSKHRSRVVAHLSSLQSNYFILLFVHIQHQVCLSYRSNGRGHSYDCCRSALSIGRRASRRVTLTRWLLCLCSQFKIRTAADCLTCCASHLGSCPSERRAARGHTFWPSLTLCVCVCVSNPTGWPKRKNGGGK